MRTFTSIFITVGLAIVSDVCLHQKVSFMTLAIMFFTVSILINQEMGG